MKVLFDNCVPRGLRVYLQPHLVKTAAEMGWNHLSNGRLLAEAAREGFEVLVTVDKNVRFQQNLNLLPIAILELAATDTRLEALSRIAPYFELAIQQSASFLFVSVDETGRIETQQIRERT